MGIEGFDYKEEYLGTGDLTDYTFDFTIFDATHLYIYILDLVGAIDSEFRGDDDIMVASVTIDDEGGGTLSLASVLPTGYSMHIFLANDEPDQQTEFPNKRSFTMEAIEGALDYIAAWGQRIAFLAQRSLRLHDLDDIDGFDMRLPKDASDNAGAFLNVNSEGDGWTFGATYAELLATIMAAVDIEIEAAMGNAGIPIYSGPYTIAPNASQDIGSATDHTIFSQVDYVARVQRGTASFVRQEFSTFYRASAWKIAIGPDRYDDAGADHNVTFTVDPVTGTINAAVANDGGNNAEIDFYKVYWPS